MIEPFEVGVVSTCESFLKNMNTEDTDVFLVHIVRWEAMMRQLLIVLDDESLPHEYRRSLFIKAWPLVEKVMLGLYGITQPGLVQ